MILKTVINRKGSYILESTISLPIFLIAVVVMCSIILMYSCIEDANFIAATEIRKSAAEAVYSDAGIFLTQRITDRVTDNHSQVESMHVEDFCYRNSRFGQDEIIAFRIQMMLSTENPMDLASNASYDLSLATRAYVGKIRSVGNMSAGELMDDNAEAVYIFPKRGEKYHSEGCRVLHAASRIAVLSDSLKRKYTSCPICHSGSAELGSLVYYFPQDGEDYHLKGCSTLERNYIEIEKSVAISRGYTACSICG